MGRGDKKTAKGKRFKGSFGKSRSHKTVSKHVAPIKKVVEVEVEVEVELKEKKPVKKATKKATKKDEKEAK